MTMRTLDTTLHRLALVLALFALTVPALIGCDDDEEDLDVCSSDSDCLNGFTCRLSSTGRGVCVSVDPTDAVDGTDGSDSTDAPDVADSMTDTVLPDTGMVDTSMVDTRPRDTSTQGLPYRYVRINDLSDTDNAITGGADIDAVILDKADGTQAFATTLEGYNHGGGQAEGPDLDPQEALFAPDAFVDYTAPDPECDLDDGYISLGGQGGYIILGMGAEIEASDELTVLEIGGCTGNDGAEGILEEVQVQVAVGFDINEQWVTVGAGEGPVLKLTVPSLPTVIE